MLGKQYALTMQVLTCPCEDRDTPGDKLRTQADEYTLVDLEAAAEAQVLFAEGSRHKAVSAAWLCAVHCDLAISAGR